MTIDEIAVAIWLPVCIFVILSAVTMLGIYWSHPHGYMKRRRKT